MKKTLYIIGGAIILATMAHIVFFSKDNASDQLLLQSADDARVEAENWIKKNATTYTYDGSDLIHLETKSMECSQCYMSIFTFTSYHSGYGDRTDVMTLQVLTPHIIEVIFKNGRLFSVITDNEYDEIAKKLLNEKKLMSVNVYFGNTKENPNNLDCSKVSPVERITELKIPPHEVTLDLLLQGPSKEEKALGYFTSINSNVKIQKFAIENGVAKVDFSKDIERNAAGSCKVIAIRSQITETLKQFPTIKEVIISVNGEVDTALQP